jgi:bifunctional NMN adenylyltransferase/nudix hydrolase
MEETKDLDVKDYEVGVVVGRFQLAEIHEGHEFLIDTVINNHKKSIIFLGVPRAIGSPEDPIRIPSRDNVLDFQSRLYMMQDKYPKSVVLSIQDKDNDRIWSESLDSKIREIFPTEKVLLYGGRDSFIPHYQGVFPVKSLDPKIYTSATMQRNSISKEVLADPNFRKGQIYYAYQQTPMLYTNYKIALMQEDKILFYKKHGNDNREDKLKLLSGLAGINDPSLEVGAKRVIGNIVGSIEVESKYEMSKSNIDFGNKTNRVMNILISAKKMYGSLKPQGNFDIQWISIDELMSEGYMVKHIEKDEFEYVQHLIKKYRKDK